MPDPTLDQRILDLVVNYHDHGLDAPITNYQQIIDYFEKTSIALTEKHITKCFKSCNIIKVIYSDPHNNGNWVLCYRPASEKHPTLEQKIQDIVTNYLNYDFDAPIIDQKQLVDCFEKNDMILSQSAIGRYLKKLDIEQVIYSNPHNNNNWVVCYRPVSEGHPTLSQKILDIVVNHQSYNLNTPITDQRQVITCFEKNGMTLDNKTVSQHFKNLGIERVVYPDPYNNNNWIVCYRPISEGYLILEQKILDIVVNYQSYGLNAPITDQGQVITCFEKNGMTLDNKTVSDYFENLAIEQVVYPDPYNNNNWTVCYRPVSENHPTLEQKIQDIVVNYRNYGLNTPITTHNEVIACFEKNGMALSGTAVGNYFKSLNIERVVYPDPNNNNNWIVCYRPISEGYPTLGQKIYDIVVNYKDYGLDTPITEHSQVITCLQQGGMVVNDVSLVSSYFKELNIKRVVIIDRDNPRTNSGVFWQPASKGMTVDEYICNYVDNNADCTKETLKNHLDAYNIRVDFYYRLEKNGIECLDGHLLTPQNYHQHKSRIWNNYLRNADLSLNTSQSVKHDIVATIDQQNFSLITDLTTYINERRRSRGDRPYTYSHICVLTTAHLGVEWVVNLDQRGMYLRGPAYTGPGLKYKDYLQQICTENYFQSLDDLTNFLKERGTFPDSALDRWMRQLDIRQVIVDTGNKWILCYRSVSEGQPTLEQKIQDIVVNYQNYNLKTPITEYKQVANCLKRNGIILSDCAISNHFKNLDIKKVVYPDPHNNNWTLCYRPASEDYPTLGQKIQDIVINYQDYGLNTPIIEYKQVVACLKQNSIKLSASAVGDYFKDLNIEKVIYLDPHNNNSWVHCYRPASEGHPTLGEKIQDIVINYQNYGFQEPIVEQTQISAHFKQNGMPLGDKSVSTYFKNSNLVQVIYPNPYNNNNWILCYRPASEGHPTLGERIQDIVINYQKYGFQKPITDQRQINACFEHNGLRIGRSSVGRYFQILNIKEVGGIYVCQQHPPDKSTVLNKKKKEKDSESTVILNPPPDQGLGDIPQSQIDTVQHNEQSPKLLDNSLTIPGASCVQVVEHDGVMQVIYVDVAGQLRTRIFYKPSKTLPFDISRQTSTNTFDATLANRTWVSIPRITNNAKTLVTQQNNVQMTDVIKPFVQRYSISFNNNQVVGKATLQANGSAGPFSSSFPTTTSIIEIQGINRFSQSINGQSSSVSSVLRNPIFFIDTTGPGQGGSSSSFNSFRSTGLFTVENPLILKGSSTVVNGVIVSNELLKMQPKALDLNYNPYRASTQPMPFSARVNSFAPTAANIYLMGKCVYYTGKNVSVLVDSSSTSVQRWQAGKNIGVTATSIAGFTYLSKKFPKASGPAVCIVAATDIGLWTGDKMLEAHDKHGTDFPLYFIPHGIQGIACRIENLRRDDGFVAVAHPEGGVISYSPEILAKRSKEIEDYSQYLTYYLQRCEIKEKILKALEAEVKLLGIIHSTTFDEANKLIKQSPTDQSFKVLNNKHKRLKQIVKKCEDVLTVYKQCKPWFEHKWDKDDQTLNEMALKNIKLIETIKDQAIGVSSQISKTLSYKQQVLALDKETKDLHQWLSTYTSQTFPQIMQDKARLIELYQAIDKIDATFQNNEKVVQEWLQASGDKTSKQDIWNTFVTWVDDHLSSRQGHIKELEEIVARNESKNFTLKAKVKALETALQRYKEFYPEKTQDHKTYADYLERFKKIEERQGILWDKAKQDCNQAEQKGNDLKMQWTTTKPEVEKDLLGCTNGLKTPFDPKGSKVNKMPAGLLHYGSMMDGFSICKSTGKRNSLALSHSYFSRGTLSAG